MSVNTVSFNKSTELFYDLAERSLDVSWEYISNACGSDKSDIIYGVDFMSTFVSGVIIHIHSNFERFAHQEGYEGDLSEVNLEIITERLVRHAWMSCLKRE